MPYDVKVDFTVLDGTGKEMPGGEVRTWTGLTKEDVVHIEKKMVSYLGALADTADKRVKGQIVDPPVVGPSDLVAVTDCIITKDGKEWASTTFRLPNQNTAYLAIMSFMWNRAVASISRKVNAKMKVK